MGNKVRNLVPSFVSVLKSHHLVSIYTPFATLALTVVAPASDLSLDSNEADLAGSHADVLPLVQRTAPRLSLPPPSEVRQMSRSNPGDRSLYEVELLRFGSL
jgi:hypothetical protein